ncbi:TPA: hypothetical protein I7730_15660 [Vibrio vulnificus]|uniref:Uncharacterized protein n=1 Tax=Vibrio vulnificus TaxID=672 RepID=A0A8H9N1S6_VIBVL|nr:hypothetical protein [Vibrio vulnificus]HAS8541218.1 hypothetical protein [Vibrio vulnificus]
MKVVDAKRLIQHVQFSDPNTRLTAREITDTYPELVRLSQDSVKNDITLHRVLMLEKGANEREFGADSTSKSLSSVLQLAHAMPAVLFSWGRMITLDPAIFTFIVPKNRVLIDLELCMPLIEKILAKVKHHTVIGKNGTRVAIGRVIDEFYCANEREVIADLSGLLFEKVTISNTHQMRTIALKLERGQVLEPIDQDDHKKITEALKNTLPPAMYKKLLEAPTYKAKISSTVTGKMPSFTASVNSGVPAF